MPSPFPGMNPYLENPELWSEVHHRLITALADSIETELSLKYRVAIEKRIYLSDGEESVEVGIPHVSVTSSCGTGKMPVQAKGRAGCPPHKKLNYFCKNGMLPFGFPK